MLLLRKIRENTNIVDLWGSEGRKVIKKAIHHYLASNIGNVTLVSIEKVEPVGVY